MIKINEQTKTGEKSGCCDNHTILAKCLRCKDISCKFFYFFPIKFVCVLQLNNRLFEELAMDVYDEVDRRENDAGEPRSASLLADV